MDNRNIPGDKQVDNILKELKTSKKDLPRVNAADVEDILKGLGVSGKKTPAETKAQPQPAPQPKPVQQAAPPPARPAPAPAQKPNAFEGAALAEELAQQNQDVQEPQPRRRGKAAAMDKVDPDKFTNDSELLSWFSDEESAPLTAAQKRQQKEQRKQQAKQEKQQKRGAGKKGKKEEEYDAPYGESLYTPAHEIEPYGEAGFESDFNQPEGSPEGQPMFGEYDGFGQEGYQTQEQGYYYEEDARQYPQTPAESFEQWQEPGAFDQQPEPMFAGEGMLEEQPLSMPELMQEEWPEPPPWPQDGTIVWQQGEPEPEQFQEVFHTASYSTESFEIVEEEDGSFATVPEETFDFLEDAQEELPESIFGEAQVDERFREFFSESVMVGPGETFSEKGRRKRKRRSKALITGEFARLAAEAEAAEEEQQEDPFDDYNRPQDADGILKDLATLKSNLLIRGVAGTVLALLALWMGLGAAGTVSLPDFISPVLHGGTFSLVYFVIILAGVIVNFTTVAAGLVGLFTEPTGDCGPALAAVGALLQGAVYGLQGILGETHVVTLFGFLALALLAANSFGKMLRAMGIQQNFRLASAEVNHSAGYVLDSSDESVYDLAHGLDEPDPNLLISRPTTLVKGFMRQSFSQRWSDKIGRILGWVLMLVGIAAALIGFFQTQNMLVALSSFTAALCIGAPLTSSLVSAIPSLLMQRAATRVGAVVPGWSAIEELGKVNVVMATGRDIFPTNCARLHSIKTFEKERIDVAILYAASVLSAGCETLGDLFLAVVQDRRDLLYKVESLVYEPGRGFTAWVNNSRITLGTREMMQRHDVEVPTMQQEMKYLGEGRVPMYLAVKGKLSALFVMSYSPNRKVDKTLEGFLKSGVSLLIKTTDMNISAALIEKTYGMPEGVVKVLGQRELEIMEPHTEYKPDSNGVMTHIGTFSSFIGGMRAASSCAASERMATILQIAAALLASVLSIMLAFSGGLAGLSLLPVVIYQLAWSIMVSAVPLARKY